MIGVIVAALGGIGLLGGYTWLQNERANRADKIWVPIPLNTELSHEQHVEFSEKLRGQVVTDERFTAIASDLDLQQRWGLPDEKSCVDELNRRLLFEVGEHNHSPTLNIGFHGISRENAMLRELTERLMKDVDQVIRPPAPPDSP